MTENEIGTEIVEVATLIHKRLGSGLLESVYEIILADQLRNRQLLVKRQARIPIRFEGMTFEEAFRADLIVGNKVIVELKCIESINNAHRKQLLSYLRLTGMKLGYLLNFNEPMMKSGIHRIVNNLID